ncbi:processive 1,2-diacylglycerol beta-glucosyltransferase [Desulfonispora thiosulfatigenes DSM 11270]|uniref:Processive 1,2-diacylglycerol beta-glucosyltransferase n=1 Tax=Desulfonispora thiosulfatigenes DSM 11270 TaxID=656914 RepID=A0A1W1UPY6_DESTI|nr:glycosyltransferase [Desulfonispora thiosulfatigenes]SMB83157.1 processive 1,2-diacylglycerol beta-glucosyltransferase [Desulfonispora thiosulfatigenes DSM 11270]
MLKPLKILIFSVSIGSGHDSVAYSLNEEIKSRSERSEVKIVDTFHYINTLFNKVVVGSYMETLKFTPKLWGYLYQQAEEGDGLVDLGQVLSHLLSPKMDKLLQDFKPDVIVCTHAFPVSILSVLKKKEKINAPLIACITDYTVHNFWVQPQVDLFVIPDIDLINPLIKEDIDTKKIKDYGIPIRKQFKEVYSKQQMRTELNLEDCPTALIMGGGLGLGNIKEITKKLLKESDLQVIVIAGKNEKLKADLEELKFQNKLHIYGYVTNIAKVMSACDILISKPGGVTIAEALTMKLPILILSSLPGQEDRNTHFLLNRGLAVKVRKIDDLITEMNLLLENPVKIKQVKEMASYLKKPESTSKTVDDIWTMAQE